MNRTPRWMRGYIASIAILAIIGALLAAGCGGGKSSADKTATAAAKAGAATATKPAVTSTAAATATKAPATTATNAPAATNTPSAATPTLKIGQVASIGSVLTNPAGLTLYTYKDDVPNSGQSAVPAAIAPNWPPLTVTGTPVASCGAAGAVGQLYATRRIETGHVQRHAAVHLRRRHAAGAGQRPGSSEPLVCCHALVSDARRGGFPA